LVVRYEQLRADVLGGASRASGLGFTLFLRQGMTAWLRAGASTARPMPMSVAPAHTMSAWSGDVRAQAASILAGILLSYRSETTPCTPTYRR
jgi:hypothetical protein